MPAMDVAGPNLADIRDEALAGQLRIAWAFACEKAKAVRNALALLGREAAVVEVARIVPEAFRFGHGRRHKSPLRDVSLAKDSSIVAPETAFGAIAGNAMQLFATGKDLSL